MRPQRSLERVGDDVHRSRKVDAPEHDPRIRWRGPQGHGDLFARVQANAGGAYHGLQGSLFEHRITSAAARKRAAAH